MHGAKKWCAALLGAMCAGTALADGSVMLAWDASPDTNVIGYHVYWGTASNQYGQPANAGNGTNYTVSGLTKGRVYHFVVTAFDADGLESDPSNEISFFVPGPVKLSIERGVDERVKLNFPVRAGQTNEVQASNDLVTWRTVWRDARPVDEWFSFEGNFSPGAQAQFYRLLTDQRKSSQAGGEKLFKN